MHLTLAHLSCAGSVTALLPLPAMLPRAFSDTRCMCSKALQSAATAQLQGGGARPAGARHGAAERRASMRVALRRAASDGHDNG